MEESAPKHRCPGCEAPPATTVGAPFVGTVGVLWWRKPFEERLFRCLEGHIYSVRVEGDDTTIEPHDSVEAWLEARTGAHAPARPPGL
jgi:hypothetical protein